jgi:hypothetical protein
MSSTPSSDITRSPLGTIDPNLQFLPSSPSSQSIPFENAPPGQRICTRCNKPKPYDQFVKKKRRPLDQENEVPLSQQDLGQSCVSCRLGVKERDQKKNRKRRETKDKELERLFESYTWEEVVMLIDNGYSYSNSELS